MTEYKKKMKRRLYLAIGYIVIGILMFAAALITKTDNSFIQAYGAALVVCGIARIVNYLKITKDEESLRKQEIEETDERNIEISKRAMSMTCSLYIFFAGTAVIVLQFLNMQEQSQMIAYNICFLVLLYWISFSFVKRKY